MTVLADDAVPTQPTAPPPAAPAKAPPPLSVEEMKTRSAQLVADNGTSYRELLHLKEVAKKQKDVIKLGCVNDKLIKIKAEISIAEETNTELQGVLTASSDARFDAYARLSEQAAAVQKTRDEGRACIGESELFKQESGVDIIRPVIIDDPGTIDPYGQSGGFEVEPPGYASPFN